jgi:hypothetical protein
VNKSTDQQIACKQCGKPLVIAYDELRKLYHHHCECWDLFLPLAVNSGEVWKTAVERSEAELGGNRLENLPVSSPEREACKKELRAKLEAEKLNPPVTVKPSTMIIRDPAEIRPTLQIAKREIEEVLNWHRELHQPMRLLLNQAIRIGAKLRGWRDLVPHGRWLEWCQQNIPEIHERMVQNYIRLWDNHEWLATRLNYETVSYLEEQPTIKGALALLADRRKAERPALVKEKRGFRPREIQTEVTIEPCPSDASSESEPVRPRKMEELPLESLPREIHISTEQLAKLCPTCRATLLEGMVA